MHDPFRGSCGLDRPATLFHLFEVKLPFSRWARLQDAGLSKGFVVGKDWAQDTHFHTHYLPLKRVNAALRWGPGRVLGRRRILSCAPAHVGFSFPLPIGIT